MAAYTSTTPPVSTTPSYVIGYRRLRLLRGGRLASVAAQPRSRGIWPTGDHTAVCAAGHSHRAPASDCGCGLYALHDPPPASRSFVLAAVCGWGDVEVHETGWRAEHARIVALAPVGRPLKRERQAASRYGVPLVAAEKLQAVAAEYGTPVSSQHRPPREASPRLRSSALRGVDAMAQRIYDALARPIRSTPGLPVLVLTMVAYAPLVGVAWLAWDLSRGGDGVPVEASGVALAVLKCILALGFVLPLGVAAARRAFGSGIPVGVPRIPVPTVLALGAVAPALSGLGVPPELLEAASALGALVASYTIGRFMAGAISRRAQTALAAIAVVAVAVVGPQRVGWLLIEIIIVGGFAAHLALQPPTADRWRRTVRRRRAAPSKRKDVWS